MNKKKIISSAIIGTIALVGLSVSLTLAWYAASDRLSVQKLQLDVAGQADLKVSTSMELDSFKSELNLTPKEDINFIPVSSMNQSSWYDSKSDTPLFYDCSTAVVNKKGAPIIKPAEKGFFRQKLYLLSSLPYYVTLDVDPESDRHSYFKHGDNALVVDEVIREIKKDYPNFDLEKTEVMEKLDSLEKCLRVSILVNTGSYYNYYIIDPFKEGTKGAQFGGVLDNDGDGYYDTYPNEDDENKQYEIIYGEVNERSNANYELVTQEVPAEGVDPYFGNSFVATSKKGVYAFDEEHSPDLEFAEEESFSIADIDTDTTKLVIPCYANTPTEIVVSIYLEGWDLDCINATMGATFETKLSFKLLRGIIG